MKKNALIKKLQAIPGNPEVVIMDYKRNEHEDDGEGTSAGNYSKFSVEKINYDAEKEDKEEYNLKPFIGLAFDNIYFPEEGE